MYELLQMWLSAQPGETIFVATAADMLEKAWHQDQHGAEWYPELCRICVREEAQENWMT